MKNSSLKILAAGFILSMLVMVFPATAQNTGSDVDPDELSLKEKSVYDYTSRIGFQPGIQLLTPNRSEILQNGSSNSANVNQQNSGTDPNVVFIIQNGNLNQTLVEQTGEGNNLQLNQAGNNNRYQVKMQGDDIHSTVNQLGDNNVLSHDLMISGETYNMTQNGDNNRLMHVDYNSRSVPPTVIQEGNNMNLRIEQR